MQIKISELMDIIVKDYMDDMGELTNIIKNVEEKIRNRMKSIMYITVKGNDHLYDKSQETPISHRTNERKAPLNEDDFVFYENYLVFDYGGHDDEAWLFEYSTLEELNKYILTFWNNPFTNVMTVIKDNKKLNFQVENNEVLWTH